MCSAGRWSQGVSYQRLDLGAGDEVVVARRDLIHLGLGQVGLGGEQVEQRAGAEPVALLRDAQRLGGRRDVGAHDRNLRVRRTQRGELLRELSIYPASRV